MKAEKVVSITKVESVEPSQLPNGTFKGHWGGYVVAVDINGSRYELRTKDGVRGMHIPCQVTIQNGEVTVEV